MFTRRQFLGGAACLAAGAGLVRSEGSAFARSLPAPAEPASGHTAAFRLVAAERPGTLPCFSGIDLPMWTYSEGDWPKLIRIDLGDRLDVALENRLPRDGEHTSIHWHGIRLPNDQDGVPHLVQKPVMPGETFRYSFVPPDTGTFFFHPHCNSAEQMGRGMIGVLIVDGDTTEPYDADEVVLLRDWLIDDQRKSFRNFVTKRGASRAGTYGNVRSANGMGEAELRLPASGDCRLRIVNTDTTRVMEIAVHDADFAVIAIDGIAIPPFAPPSWLLGPAMRMDIVVRAPAEGRVARIVDERQDDAVPLIKLIGTGRARRSNSFNPAPLRAGHIPEPGIDGAAKLDFVFALAGDPRASVTADDPVSALALGSLCLSSDGFWTINSAAWPAAGHSTLPPPLARLERGRSYVWTLRNASQLMHPVHIHGHTFKVLRSDKRSLPIHYADTVLLLPDETVEVALVADNPGRWMFHCHVIEHQETGMMGYLEVA